MVIKLYHVNTIRGPRDIIVVIVWSLCRGERINGQACDLLLLLPEELHVETVTVAVVRNIYCRHY